MDYNYFKNDSGKYVAKKLPNPTKSRVKIKDVTYLDELREDLRYAKPTTDHEFEKLYEEAMYGQFEVEVESFESAVRANRNDFLGENTWLRKYWNSLGQLIEGLDEYELELEEDAVRLEPKLAKQLLKEDLVTQVTELDHAHWFEDLNTLSVPEIKELCKSNGITIGKKRKAVLIDELIQLEEEKPKTLKAPFIAIAKPIIVTKIREVFNSYVNEIEQALTEFDYPVDYQLAVWEWAQELAEGEIYELINEKIESINEKHKNKRPKAVNDLEPLSYTLEFPSRTQDSSDTTPSVNIDESATGSSLSEAILTGQTLSVIYFGENSEHKVRQIIPLHFIGKDKVKALCLNSNIEKHFFIDKLSIIDEEGVMSDSSGTRLSDSNTQTSPKHTAHTSPFVNTLTSIFNWGFGTMCLLAGLGAFSESIIVAFSYIGVALFLLPPARKLTFKIANKQLPTFARIICVFALIIIGGSALEGANEEKLEVSNNQEQLNR